MVPPQVRLAKGTVLDRRFVVERVLGQGGMGIVIAARHQALRKTVAIKMMRPEYSGSPELAQRFLREARAAARLRSEHVVRVTDVDVFASGVPYFIMEYSPGLDLAKHLEQHGPLGVDQVVELLLQTLEALAEAHRAGIVHRDLKPANLLLTTREDDSPSIKVLDFGISKCTEVSVAGGRLTEVGSMLGSPVYMSPEQIRDASTVDGRADIWSLGVVAYELLTGSTPFRGRTAQALIAAICSEEPPALPASISPSLALVLSKCLAKRADDRFQSVAELAKALAPLSTGLGAQLSLERILRRRSSAPPALVDTERQSTRMATARALELRRPRPLPTKTVIDSAAASEHLVSLPPYERDTRESSRSVPGAKRRGSRLVRGAVVALVALGAVAFWFSRREAEPSTTRTTVAAAQGAPPAAPAAIALPELEAPAPAPAASAGAEAAANPALSAASLPAPSSSSARLPNRASHSDSSPQTPRRAPRRKLDHENPFAR